MNSTLGPEALVDSTAASPTHSRHQRARYQGVPGARLPRASSIRLQHPRSAATNPQDDLMEEFSRPGGRCEE